MTASDSLGLQFQYQTVEGGERFPRHEVTAMLGETQVGRMQWTHRAIRSIDTEPEYARQGVATAMWNEGHRLAEQHARIPKPKHSTDRTDMGDKWAKAVGGRLPRRNRA